MFISSLVLVLRALFLASWTPTVYAQETNATCRPGYEWMENSLGQSPCLVTAWLNVPCTGTGDGSQVLALPPGSYYIGPRDPSSPGAPQCGCNTVIYSVLAACTICQNGGLGVQPWPAYSANCVVTTNGSYPEPIPGGTAVPKWAFLDVIRNSTFNVDAAEAVAFQKQPDITIEGSSTSSSAGPSSSVLPTTTTDNAKRSGGSKNAGAIVGGVFGAVIGVLLVGGLAICILRRRKETRRDQNFGGSQIADVREVPGWAAPSHHVPTVTGTTGSVTGFYDPDDPRTYPATQSSMAGSSAGYTGLPQVMS